ncbi:sensor histidine kinase [Candidatus Leptofilum sp.]|uniref:sensor histidine kinase n=1 Tax=Candidatus Leptofilum sp. TaxID=3241576 RepID=UPI003B5B17EB
MSSNLPSPNPYAQQLETIGFLATGIAHDFSNLLTSIVGQTSLALATLPQDNVARSHIEKAMQAAEFAAELTRQLLTYANSEDAPDELIDLNQLVNDNISLLNTILLKSVSLQLDLANSLPPIEARRAHIQQIVMNLLINAAESIEDGKGIVLLRTGLETICDNEKRYSFVNGRSPVPGPCIYLQITDTGCGMTRQQLQKIFSPFYTTKPTGRGLGLSTVLDLVGFYQGGITVESQTDLGTTFCVFLPLPSQLGLMPKQTLLH